MRASLAAPLLGAALLAAAGHAVALSSSSSSLSSDSPAPVTPTLRSCEQLGLTPVFVLGSPNAFCLADEPCAPTSVSSCPSAMSYDVQGALFTHGSCCATLESTGVVGCVSLDLTASSNSIFQCVTPKPNKVLYQSTDGASPSSPSGSAADATPPWSHVGSKPSTPPPFFPSPTSTTKTQTQTPDIVSRPSVTPIASGSSSGSSMRWPSDSEPDAGDEPRPTTKSPGPSSPAPLPTPAHTVGNLATLEPITDAPHSTPGAVYGSSASTSTSTGSSPTTNKDNKPLSSGSGKTIASSGSAITSVVSDNVVLILVVGSVGTIAVVFGAVMLRRRSSSEDKPSRNIESTLPPLTPEDPEDDIFRLHDDPQGMEPFSPIQVLAADANYSESKTPGHDRQSYYL